MLTLYFKAFSWSNTHKISIKVFADLNMAQRHPVFVLAYKITEQWKTNPNYCYSHFVHGKTASFRARKNR